MKDVVLFDPRRLPEILRFKAPDKSYILKITILLGSRQNRIRDQYFPEPPCLWKPKQN